MEEVAEETMIYSVDNIPLFQEARRQWYNNQQTKMVEHNNDNDNDNDNQSELSNEYEYNY